MPKSAFAAFWLCLACVAAAPACAAQAACDETYPALFRAASPSVVRVGGIAVNPHRLAGRVKMITGSGFVIDPGDLIVTNSHVVHGAKALIVQSGDGPPLPVDLVGEDPVLDIAVLKLHGAETPRLPALKLGSSANLPVGESVMAIGNPFGIGETATAGVVSAVNRVLPISTMSYLTPFIQFDAAVNPGNSGGPLMNRCGEVVGVTTATIRQAQSIGFAVPIDAVRTTTPELVAHGHVARAWHGLYGRMADPFISMLTGLPPISGFMIETVEPGSPADKIGLKGGALPVTIATQTFLLGGDVITKVDGVEITDMDMVRRVVGSLKIGQTVHLDYYRAGEGELHADVVLPERPLMESDFEFEQDGG